MQSFECPMRSEDARKFTTFDEQRDAFSHTRTPHGYIQFQLYAGLHPEATPVLLMSEQY
jgi:hypothetical protein